MSIFVIFKVGIGTVFENKGNNNVFFVFVFILEDETIVFKNSFQEYIALRAEEEKIYGRKIKRGR